MPNVISARIARTNWLADNRASFLDVLRSDIRELCNKASKRGLIPAVRINGTSDLPGIARQLAREFPTVSFYDYTKHKAPWVRRESNYHITYSYSGHNWTECEAALAHDVNVAVVFHVAKGQPLPLSYQGYPVIDGDTNDLRFLDPKRVYATYQDMVAGEAALPEAITMAGFGGFRVVSVDYRMPPHHPYPAPLDDCVAAYRALLERYEHWQIVVTGASAGGNLAAATVLRARDEPGLVASGTSVLLAPDETEVVAPARERSSSARKQNTSTRVARVKP